MSETYERQRDDWLDAPHPDAEIIMGSELEGFDQGILDAHELIAARAADTTAPLQIPGAYVHAENVEPILKYAKARGFTAITYSELVAALVDGGSLPHKPYTLSADDEPTEWLTNTDPLLATYGAKMTGFISSGYPDSEVMQGGTNTFFYTDTQPLSWTQLRALRDTGRWDFQNHSRTHRGFSTLSTVERTAEWDYSQARILAELGVTPRVFQFPTDIHNLTAIQEAASRFDVIGVGHHAYSTFNSQYGPQDRMATPFIPGRGRHKNMYWRASPGSVACLEDVLEPPGANRIPDMPLDDNSLGVWTVTGGTEGSSTDGVRFDQPDKSGKIDLRSNATGDVTAITTHYIAMRPGETVCFAYYRECGVTGGSYVITIKEYDYGRAALRDTVFETLTGTEVNDDKIGRFTVPADTDFVKLEVKITGAPSGSYATFQLPFFGALR